MKTTKTTARRAELVALRAMKAEAIRNAEKLGEYASRDYMLTEFAAIDHALATERVGRI